MPDYNITDTKSVVKITAEVSSPCKVCNCTLSDFHSRSDIALAINHYIGSHNYILLHIGTETTDDINGNPWHNTVAILGK